MGLPLLYNYTPIRCQFAAKNCQFCRHFSASPCISLHFEILSEDPLFMRIGGLFRECAIQGSNSAPLVDNQELGKQDSQGDSQKPFGEFDDDLRMVIKAWDNLPPSLKTAVVAIVSSSREE